MANDERRNPYADETAVNNALVRLRDDGKFSNREIFALLFRASAFHFPMKPRDGRSKSGREFNAAVAEFMTASDKLLAFMNDKK